MKKRFLLPIIFAALASSYGQSTMKVIKIDGSRASIALSTSTKIKFVNAASFFVTGWPMPIEVKNIRKIVFAGNTASMESRGNHETIASRAHPNPFNPVTTIHYGVERDEFVTISIFNSQGKRVTTLVNHVVKAGKHSLVWDARDQSQNRLASGQYILRIKAGEKIINKKLVLVK